MQEIKKFKIGHQTFEGVKSFAIRIDQTVIIEPTFSFTRYFIDSLSEFNHFEEIHVQLKYNDEWKEIKGPFSLKVHHGYLVLSKKDPNSTAIVK